MLPPFPSEAQVLLDPEQVDRKPQRILVVEDDPSSRRALVMLLQLRGFAPAMATTQTEALEKLASQPECVLLDLMLPDGSGTAVLQYIRDRHLPIRVAVTSGAADYETLLEGTTPDALFPKPLDVEQLLRWIEGV